MNLYGRRWKKARKTFLSRSPLCVWCQKSGKLVQADTVDHIKPHRNNLALFWDSTNWQPLCKRCHDSHKQRFEKSGMETGGDVNGRPSDPKHHWNIGRGGSSF